MIDFIYLLNLKYIIKYEYTVRIQKLLNHQLLTSSFVCTPLNAHRFAKSYTPKNVNYTK